MAPNIVAGARTGNDFPSGAARFRQSPARAPEMDANGARTRVRPGPVSRDGSGGQAVNELPQPQPPVAFGFLNVKPDPIMVVT